MPDVHDPGPDSSRRLESWKEIADFLGVSVRTAQLWEKERGLPVRRLGGNRRSRVHAYANELETWLRASGEPPATAPPAPARPASPPAPRRDDGWRTVLAGGLVLLFLVAWALVAEEAPPTPARLHVHGELLQAFDQAGNQLWSRRLPGLFAGEYREGPLESGKALLVDLDRDGVVEVLFESLTRNAMAESSTLYCLSAGGEIRWQRRVGEGFDGLPPDVAGAFRLRHWELIRRDEGDRLLTLAGHSPRYPMEVALLDAATGEIVGAPYHHPGHFYHWIWRDVDGDGDDELILGGVNNPGPGLGRAGLAILDVPFDAGGTVRTDFFGEPGPLPLAYVLFPRMDAEELSLHRNQVIRISPPADGGPGELRAVISIGKVAFLYYDLVYRGPGEVEVQRVFATDAFPATHRILVEAGELRDPDPDAVLSSMRRIAVSRETPDGNAGSLPE